MNILYYLRSHPSSTSFIAREIESLTKKGHNVIVFSQANRDSKVEHIDLDKLGIQSCYSPISIGSLSGLATSKLYSDLLVKTALRDDQLKYSLINMAQAGNAIRFLSKHNINVDLIHSHFAAFSQFPAIYLSRYLNIPWSVTAHAADIYSPPRPYYRDAVLKNVDRIVTISKYNRDYISELQGISTQIDVVRAGIGPWKFQPKKKTIKNRIVTVASPTEKKGYPTALRAIADVVNQVDNLEYRIIGWEKKNQPELTNLIHDLDISGNVQVLGKIPDEKLINEVDRAELFLLPSQIAVNGDRDGIPVALMEAMALETPPISTEVSGIPELIQHGVNGFLVQQQDVNQLSNCIRNALKSDLSEIKSNSRAKVSSEFNIQNEINKLETIFNQMK